MTPNLLDELEELRLPHTVCDDGWYSCPKSGECLNDAQGDDCNCGADKHNAKLDSLRTTLADMAKRLEAAERDSKRLDWLERNALYVTLDGREHDEMTIGADRGSLDAAIAKENERG